MLFDDLFCKLTFGLSVFLDVPESEYILIVCFKRVLGGERLLHMIDIFFNNEVDMRSEEHTSELQSR